MCARFHRHSAQCDHTCADNMHTHGEPCHIFSRSTAKKIGRQACDGSAHGRVPLLCQVLPSVEKKCALSVLLPHCWNS